MVAADIANQQMRGCTQPVPAHRRIGGITASAEDCCAILSAVSISILFLPRHEKFSLQVLLSFLSWTLYFSFLVFHKKTPRKIPFSQLASVAATRKFPFLPHFSFFPLEFHLGLHYCVINGQEDESVCE
jgi:hypothetical protein